MSEDSLINKRIFKLLFFTKNIITNKKEILNIFHDKFIRARFWSYTYSSHGFWFWLYKIFSRKFKVGRNTYHYFYHIYNTIFSERVVEVPIIWEILNRYKGKDVLEVGNVLSNYFTIKHDILDKYEKAKGVINQDVVDFHTTKKYDLIISISTFEHVGWDETPREPMKIINAIENLRNLLTPKGKIVVTLPIGYNPYLDKLLKEDKIPFSKRVCLKRISKDNKWKDVNWKDISDLKFNDPFPCANGLIIGIIKKNEF